MQIQQGLIAPDDPDAVRPLQDEKHLQTVRLAQLRELRGRLDQATDPKVRAEIQELIRDVEQRGLVLA